MAGVNTGCSQIETEDSVRFAQEVARRKLDAAMRAMWGVASSSEEEEEAEGDEREYSTSKASNALIAESFVSMDTREPSAGSFELIDSIAPEPLIASLNRKQRKKLAAKQKRQSEKKAALSSHPEPAPRKMVPDNQQQQQPPPTVIVFNHTARQKDVADSEAGTLDLVAEQTLSNYKSFMSFKISKMTEFERAAAEPLTRKEQAEEEDLRRKDVELQELLNASRLVEDFNAGELTGVDRRRWREKRLVELGAKAQKAPTAPMAMRRALSEGKRARARKELEEAQNTGMLTDSLRTKIQARIRGKVAIKRNRDRGINGTVGKYSNGSLFVSKHVIAQVTNAAKSKKSVGRKNKR